MMKEERIPRKGGTSGLFAKPFRLMESVFMTPGRELFWEIGDVWVFYVIAALAVGLLLIGVAAHVWVWLKSAPGSRTAFSRQALKANHPGYFFRTGCL